jgi:hypothetical protein
VAQSKPAVRIFLSYAREDQEMVEILYQKLVSAGFKPWMDRMDILPGEVWMESIRSAIEQSDFFLACLSSNSVSKRGVLQKEIRSALDLWQGMFDSDIYFIPVRLDNCEVPNSMTSFQWVDLYKSDGFSRLEKSLREGMERRRVNPSVVHRPVAEPIGNDPKPNTASNFLTNLHRGMTESYNLEELKDLCIDLGVDFENLGGEGKNGKIRELIAYLNRRGQLSKLIEKCRADRPDYPW